ncbi:MAG: isoleucine--tRNA ligase [Proteobacteria bacterium]|nr:isoleucine--tRNA ligase [Pseudomonadota bacterium]
MTDYKDTVFLPKTDFPMRGNLPQMEPKMLEKWRAMGLYDRVRAASKGKPLYVLHAGPPYANGHLHIGHAYTGILKDIVVRYKQLQGYDAPFVPGWDCHGLPIEWKIEERVRASGKHKEDVPLLDFRAQCRTFAKGWMDVQNAESQRLGILADWARPYNTMDFASEAITTGELLKLLMAGKLYKGVKPVMWSVVEKTALADTEVEYRDHTSFSIFVRFPIVKSERADLVGASVLIWTTTPWTLPGNRAVAYHKDVTYSLIEVSDPPEGSLALRGEKLIVASDLLEAVATQTHLGTVKTLATFEGSALEGTFARHCLWEEGYDFEVPLLYGDHVTTDAGTGLVHTAPTHGPEDFALGKKYGLEIPDTVSPEGIYNPSVKAFAGLHVFKAHGPILDALVAHGRLLFSTKLVHSYPHSWRSKAPLIYRTTPQWFLSMDGLRDEALHAIEGVTWYPAQSRNRIRAMVEGRPDWCLSRQRAWGVPLAIFMNKHTGQPLLDEAVNARIVAATKEHGCDAWFATDPQVFLGSAYKVEDFEQVRDVLDVWFDSAATQAFVLEERDELVRPADLYLEGSDQHRGWFQTSLLLGCAARGSAPFKGVVTHGFVLDEKGQKMSKSLGNGVEPQAVMDKSGAEILRLWTVNSDYTDDCRVGPEILKSQEDLYRRFRNTLRYLLGALDGYDASREAISFDQMPELERYMLHQVHALHHTMQTCLATHSYQAWFAVLHTFCAVDLSAFYFDMRKDVLYCDAPSSLARRATRHFMSILLEFLMRALAPVLCFTADEAWGSLGREGSVHMATFEAPDEAWKDDALAARFDTMRAQRRVMTGALEVARKDGLVGSSLQAHLVLYDPNGLLDHTQPWHALTIVSSFEVVKGEAPEGAHTSSDIPGLGVVVQKAKGEKCQRCWQVLEEVGQSALHPTLCARCEKVVA